jgi:SAM-dependent methyltransferase
MKAAHSTQRTAHSPATAWASHFVKRHAPTIAVRCALCAVRSEQSDDYDRYVRAEWAKFIADPARARALLDAVAGRNVARVLDVGCGAGQELAPFLAECAGAPPGSRLGVGVDLAPDVGRAGRELHTASATGLRRPPAFVRGAAEALPFREAAFDVVICRLALPYTDNARSLTQIARVLRPGGVLILKIHHPRFYLRELGRAAQAHDARAAAHALRALAAGAAFHLAGRQPRSRLTGRETFQTRWLLRRLLARHGLRITRELPDSNPATPSYLIEKSLTGRRGDGATGR